VLHRPNSQQGHFVEDLIEQRHQPGIARAFGNQAMKLIVEVQQLIGR
jgi:hypothetical protein